MKGNRGIIDGGIILFLCGVFGGAIVGQWHPIDRLFGKKPPTVQLTELQVKLDEQQKQAAQAAKDAEAAKVAERAKLESQIRSAQLDNVGAQEALSKVPKAHQTPEVILAGKMVDRTSFKLGAAVGKLPPEDQQAMVDLIEQMLSGKQAEVDEANRKLAALDEQFKATTSERDALKAQIPPLEEKARKAAQIAQETQAAVTEKTQEVKTWADKTQAALAENGSLWSSIKRGIFMLGGAYVFLAFILPAVVKHMATGNPLKTVLRDASGLILNPLTHLDAKAKLNELKAELEKLNPDKT